MEKSNEERLKKIISKHLSIKIQNVDLNTLIISQAETRPWGKLMDLFNSIQREFDVYFSVEDIKKLTNVEKVLNFINYHQEHS